MKRNSTSKVNYIVYIIFLVIIIFMIGVILWLYNRKPQIILSEPRLLGATPQNFQSPQPSQPSQLPQLYQEIPQSIPQYIVEEEVAIKPNKVYDVLQSFGIQKINTKHKDYMIVGTLYNTPVPPAQKVILNLYKRNTSYFDRPAVILYQKDPYNEAKYLVQDKNGFFTPLDIDSKKCLKTGDVITDIPPFTDEGPFIVQLYQK